MALALSLLSFSLRRLIVIVLPITRRHRSKNMANTTCLGLAPYIGVAMGVVDLGSL